MFEIYGLYINKFKSTTRMSYGRLKERKLHEKDYEMSCQQARQELSEYINQDAQRVNIDSAKKRAVLQHMDYEGFRQMVLGANIFPTKSKQFLTFTKSEVGPQERQGDNPKKEADSQVAEKIQGKSERHCTSFREFKKKFMQGYIDSGNSQQLLDSYNLVKEQNEERMHKIFSSDCEGGILVKIADVFSTVLGQMRKQGSEGVEDEVLFMLMFFKKIVSIPTITEMSLLILSKKQRSQIADLLLSFRQILGEDRHEQIVGVSQVFMKG